jgi:hypothetical protein
MGPFMCSLNSIELIYFLSQVQISAYEKADRDAMLAQLHSMYDSKALLEADWKHVKNTSPAADVEKTQHKLFKALMKQKKAVCLEVIDHFSVKLK